MSMNVSESCCAEILRALADQTRLNVVRTLLLGPRRVSELNQQLQIDQSLLSHHLRVLREKNFVVAERDGKSVRYRLAAPLEHDRQGAVINLGCCRIQFD